MVVVAQHYTKDVLVACMYEVGNEHKFVEESHRSFFWYRHLFSICWAEFTEISFLQTLSSQEAWCPLRSSRTTASPAKRVPLAMTRQEEARGRRIGRRRLPRLQGHRLQGQEPHSQPRTTPSVSRKEGSGSPEWQKTMCECRSPCL